MNKNQNTYAIFQVSPAYPEERFQAYAKLKARGKSPDTTHYTSVYEGTIASNSDDKDALLESMFIAFNKHIPKGFRGHSLSVSDIIRLTINGQTTYHYVDSIGFQEFQLDKPETACNTAERYYIDPQDYRDIYKVRIKKQGPSASEIVLFCRLYRNPLDLDADAGSSVYSEREVKNEDLYVSLSACREEAARRQKAIRENYRNELHTLSDLFQFPLDHDLFSDEDALAVYREKGQAFGMLWSK